MKIPDDDKELRIAMVVLGLATAVLTLILIFVGELMEGGTRW